ARFDPARRLADAAAGAANKSGDAALARLTANRGRDVKEVETARGQVDPLVSKHNPAPGGESLQVGKFDALLKGDWPRGLPYLAAGNDPALKALADKELAPPTDTDALVALADGWGDLAGEGPGL